MKPEEMAFCTLISDRVEALSAYRFVHGLRTFGGDYAKCPVWLIARSPDALETISFANVSMFPIEMELPAYPFV